MFLATNAPSNQERMAQYWGIDKGAITKSISKLEEKGYLERTENVRNKREKIVSLTPRGEGVLDEMRAVYRDWENGVCGAIDPADMDTTLRTLQVMAESASRVLSEMES